MTLSAKLLIVLIVSELAAAYAIWRIVRTSDFWWMKVALAAIALIPVLGPVLALWIGNFPDKAPPSLQNRSRSRGSARYYARWRDVINEKSPVRRFRLWRSEVDRDLDEDP